MDANFMTDLLLSLAIFAPGLLIFGLLALVGVLMMAEKSGMLRGAATLATEGAEAADAACENPAPGAVVTSLREALAEGAEEHGERRASGAGRVGS